MSKHTKYTHFPLDSGLFNITFGNFISTLTVKCQYRISIPKFKPKNNFSEKISELKPENCSKFTIAKKFQALKHQSSGNGDVRFKFGFD